VPVEVALARRRSVREYAARSVTALCRSVYPIVRDVVGLAPGVYHYAVQRHGLELLRTGNFRQEVFEAALSQEMLLRASFVLVLTGLFARVHWKYVDRSYRYILLEAGHLGENVYLAATSLGLAPGAIGAYFDDDINRLLGVDGRVEAVRVPAGDRRQVAAVTVFFGGPSWATYSATPMTRVSRARPTRSKT
jgi:SagB-type dehydrogenase family enzyme